MKRTINLIPDDYFLRRAVRARLIIWGVVFAVALPALVGLYGWERAQGLALERRLGEHRLWQARLRESAAQLAALRQTRESLQVRQGAVRSLLSSQANTLLLAELEQAVERGVWLTLLEVDRGSGQAAQAGEQAAAKADRQTAPAAAAVKMRGYAPSHAALARLLARLSQTAWLERPRLSYAKAVRVQERGAVEFEIEAELRCT